MVQVMDTTGTMAGPAIFFFALMIIGNYMLLNLFLAILLKFISENNEGSPAEEGLAVKGLESSEKETTGEAKSPAVEPHNHSFDDSVALNSSNSNIEEEFEKIKE